MESLIFSMGIVIGLPILIGFLIHLFRDYNPYDEDQPF